MKEENIISSPVKREEVPLEQLTPYQRHLIKLTKEHKERSVTPTAGAIIEQLRESVLGKDHKSAKPVRKEVETPVGKTPDAEMLKNMQSWAVEYRRKNKKASEREVKRAVCNHFNVKIVD